MIERVLSLQHSRLALGEETETCAPSEQRRGFAAFKDAMLRLLRKIGEFLATGGPLS